MQLRALGFRLDESTQGSTMQKSCWIRDAPDARTLRRPTIPKPAPNLANPEAPNHYSMNGFVPKTSGRCSRKRSFTSDIAAWRTGLQGAEQNQTTSECCRPFGLFKQKGRLSVCIRSTGLREGSRTDKILTVIMQLLSFCPRCTSFRVSINNPSP